MKSSDPDLLAAWDAYEASGELVDYGDMRSHAFIAGWNAAMASVKEERKHIDKITREEKREQDRWEAWLR